jgi:anti-sigma-K factor RskA
MDDELLDALRRTRPDDEPGWIDPPSTVWDAIEAGIAGTSPPAAAPAVRRRHVWVRAAVGVAAAVVVAVALALVVRRAPGDTVVAEARLEPLVPGASGDARLVDRDGSMRLRLDASGLGATDGFYEVWLIDPTVSRLVSLGPLRPDGLYELPSSIDPHEFPIVDVSIEPTDGEPAHSGVSVLRSELRFTA